MARPAGLAPKAPATRPHRAADGLSKNRGAPRRALAATRHSSRDLTMLVRQPYGGLARLGEIVYSDPTLLDVAGALGVLPRLRPSSGHAMQPMPTEPQHSVADPPGSVSRLGGSAGPR